MIKLTNSVSTQRIAYIPTKLNEISAEFLTTITKTVSLNNYQCIVALVTKTKLFDFAAYIGNPNNNREFSVTPILAKINNVSDLPIKVNPGDKIVTSRSEIERGVHINIPTMCSSTRLSAFIQEDKELFKSILKGTLLDEEGNNIAKETIYIVEFKILPINAIFAAVNSSFTKYVATNDKFQDVLDKDGNIKPKPNAPTGTPAGGDSTDENPDMSSEEGQITTAPNRTPAGEQPTGEQPAGENAGNGQITE